MTTVFSRVVADVSVQFVEKFSTQFDFLGLLQRICEDTGVNITASDNHYSLQGLWSPMERAHGMLSSALSVYNAAETVNLLRHEQDNVANIGSRPFSALVEAAEALSRGDVLTEQVQKDLLKVNTLSSCMTLPSQLPMQSSLVPVQSVPTQEVLSSDVLPSVASLAPLDTVVPLSTSTSQLPVQSYMPLPPFETIHASRHMNCDQPLTASDSNSIEIIQNSEVDKSISDSESVKREDTDMYIAPPKQNNSAESDMEYTLIDQSSDRDWHPGDSPVESEIYETEKVDKPKSKKEPNRREPKRRITRNSAAKAAESSMPVKKRGRARKPNELPTSAASVVHKKVKKKYMTQKTIISKPEIISPSVEKEIPEEQQTTDLGEAESPDRRGRGRPKKTAEDVQVEFPCNQCDFVAKTRNTLGDHKHRIHLAEPTMCDQCGKVFPNARYMKRHRASHVEPQHCCDICGKMYKVLKALRDHRKKHDMGYKAPEFQCKLCPKSFCTRYILECHVKSEHMGMKRSFLCATCGKSFTTKHTLQQHANVHVGARPYPCDICGKSFSYESALRDHKYIHTGTKQFICKLCSKAFRQRSALKMHEKIHQEQKDFTCEECGRGFTQKQALQRHLRAHKGDKPFSCKLCGRTFGDASIIRRHMILVHKIHKDISNWREDIVENVKPIKDFSVKSSNGSSDEANAKLLFKSEDSQIDMPTSYQPVESSVTSVPIHPHLMPTASAGIQEIPVPVPVECYSASVLHGDIDAQHQPSASAGSVEDRAVSDGAYVLNTPTPSHLDYSHIQQSPGNNYVFPITTVESHHYQTVPRSSELIHVRLAEQEQDHRQAVEGNRSVYVDQRILENARLLEVSGSDRPVDATIASSVVSSVETSIPNSRPSDSIPSRSVDGTVVRSPDQGQVRTEDAVKKSHDSEPPENLSISSLYAYYANLASTYMNVAQYIPHSDNSGSQ